MTSNGHRRRIGRLEKAAELAVPLCSLPELDAEVQHLEAGGEPRIPLSRLKATALAAITDWHLDNHPNPKQPVSRCEQCRPDWTYWEAQR